MSSYGLWLSASGMQLAEHRQSVSANNMANTNTPGFKHDYTVVANKIARSMSLGDGKSIGLPGGFEAKQNHIHTDQGPLIQTGQPLDVAIQGEGYFSIDDGGVTRYTRDGRFTRNLNGELVLASGLGQHKVLNAGNQPVNVGVEGKIRITESGRILRDGEEIDSLGIVRAVDQQQMVKRGANLFDTAEVNVKQANATVVSETIESSTYDPVAGLTDLIEAARSHQINANMLRMQDDMTGRVITGVGRMQ